MGGCLFVQADRLAGDTVSVVVFKRNTDQLHLLARYFMYFQDYLVVIDNRLFSEETQASACIDVERRSLHYSAQIASV